MQLQGHVSNVYPLTRPPDWPPEGLVGGNLNYLDIDRVERFGPFHRHGREPVQFTGNPTDVWYSAPKVAQEDAGAAYPVSQAYQDAGTAYPVSQAYPPTES